jgi:hypothetical protein
MAATMIMMTVAINICHRVAIKTWQQREDILKGN